MLYAVWAETGFLKENELLNLRKVDSILEGHPVPVRQQLDSGSSGSESHLFTSNVTCLGSTSMCFGGKLGLETPKLALESLPTCKIVNKYVSAAGNLVFEFRVFCNCGSFSYKILNSHAAHIKALNTQTTV